MSWKPDIAGEEIKLLERCYEIICEIPEQENKDIADKLHHLELDLYRYFK